MNRIHGLTVIACALALTASAATVVRGGNLNPPFGAIVPTDRATLSQTLTPPPYIISTPGSYKLTSNLTGFGGPYVVSITATGVTLDLNGFTIDGSGVTSVGVDITGRDVRVYNGRVVNCITHGVKAHTAGGGGDKITVEDMRILNCDIGMFLISTSRIARCEVENCPSGGIHAGVSPNIETLRLSGCGTNPGANALYVGNQAIVKDAQIGGGCEIGVRALGFVIVERCHVQANSYAFYGQADTEFRACTAQCPSGTGFRLEQSRAIECRVTQCLIGIDAASDAIVDRCDVRGTQNDGIRVGPYCLITGNHVAGCGGAVPGSGGIRITGDRSRVSGNHATDNSMFNYGCFGPGSTVYGNSATGLGISNYLIGGSDVAPVTTAAASTNANNNIAN